MKRNFMMGLALLLGMTFSAPIASLAKGNHSCKANNSAQGYYTQYYGNKPELIKAAKDWYAKGEWRNGFDKADAHSSVNLVDFYLQYQKNPKQWRTARTSRSKSEAAKAITITSTSSMW